MKKTTLLLVLSFCLCLLMTSLPAFAEDGLDEYNLGLGLYKQRRWELASKTFQGFIAKHPKHPKVALGKLYLGQTLINLSKYKEARTTLREFEKLSPKNVNIPQAKYRIAECSYFLDEFKTSVSEFQAYLKSAKKNDPLLEWALPYLADAQYRSGDSASAIKTFQQAIDQFPRGRMLDDSLFKKALAHQSLNQLEKAIPLYQALAKKKTSRRAAQSRLNYGLILFDQKKYVDAANSFLQLEKDFPKSKLVPFAQLNGGFAFYYQKKFPQAIQSFEKAARFPAQASSAKYWAGMSYKNLKQYDKAIEQLKPLAESNKDPKVQEESFLQWADCEIRLNQPKQARLRYADFVTRFKKSSRAPFSLQRATEAALLEENSEAGLALVKRFQTEFPKSPLLSRERLLEGQLLIQQGLSQKGNASKPIPDSKELNEAKRVLQALVQAPKEAASITNPARFHLARAEQAMGEHAAVLATLKPLLQDKKTNFPAAYLVQAISQLKLEQWPAAEKSSKQFLNQYPNDARSEQALSSLAIALSHNGKLEESKGYLQKLSDQFPKSPLVAESVYRVAETTLDGKNFKESESLFDSLTELGPKSRYYTAALHGLAWSQFEGKAFEKSVKTFKRLADLNPKEKQKLAAESRYMQGLSLLRGKQFEPAAAAFVKCYTDFSTRPKKGESAVEKRSVKMNEQGYIAYEAGREAARSFTRLKKAGDANKAYQAAYDEMKLQPKAKQGSLDKLLDEWALLNYNQENYTEADRLYELLIRESPQSDRADDARLILAESDFMAGRIQAAKKVFEKLSTDVAADDNVQRRALYQLTGIELELEKWDVLKTISERYSKKFPRNPKTEPEVEFYNEIQSRLATARFELGNPKESLKIVEPIIQLYLNKNGTAKVNDVEREWVPNSWMLKVEALRQIKKYDDCRATAVQFKIAFPQSRHLAEAFVSAGRCDIAQAKFDDARKKFQSVIDDANGRKTNSIAKAQFYIAETYMIQKKFNKALPLYLRVDLVYPGFPEIQSSALYQAGQCDEVLGNIHQAIDSYRRLLKQYPKSVRVKNAQARLKALTPK